MHYKVQSQLQSNYCTLQFIRELCNFMHIISMQMNAAAVALTGSGSSRIHRRISVDIRFWSNFKNLNPAYA